jgi:nucleoside-diphosphate-sugar epimerase
MTQTSRILITGAGGFIGRPLCDALVQKGYGVTGVVRTSQSEDNLQSGVDFKAVGDLEVFEDWEALLTGVDSVCHLAAKVHVMGADSAKALDEYRSANVVVTEKLLRAAVSAGVRRFVFLSSVKALGEGCRTPYTETSAADPIDPYGVSKLEAEQAVKAVGNETGIETVILRLPLVYGPGVRANFLRLMKMVAKGFPLPLSGVTNRRSMIYLGNLVDALQVCLHHEKAAGETFMVSDGDDFSTPGLIREIAGAMGRKPRLLPFPPTLLRATGTLAGKGQEVDRLLSSLSVDTRKIRSSLDWVPPYTVQQGIARTVEWYLASSSKSQVH